MVHNFCPLVTVIIPIYNGANYVREAIDSVISQTYKNIEIIVVNYGSKDNIDKIIKLYGNKIRYYKKENVSFGSALNLAIKKAKGDYISWLSNDNLYYPNKIKNQIDFLSKFLNIKKMIVFSDYEVINCVTRKKYFNKAGKLSHFKISNFDASLLMLFSSNLHSCTLLIPKNAFYNVSFFDESKKNTQDYYLWFEFLKRDYKFLYIPKRLVFVKNYKSKEIEIKKDFNNKELVKLFKWALENFSDNFNRINKKTLKKINDELKKYQIPELHSNSYSTNKKYKFRNLQINNTDIVGNKFNGYDLHIQLRLKNIDSKCLVWVKESKDKNTYSIGEYLKNKNELIDYAVKIQKQYSLNGVFNPISYEILYNQLFLDSNVVHFHLMNNDIFDIQLLPLFSRLKPIVWTIHDPWILGGHCIHHYDCQKWQSHCKDCPYLNTCFSLKKDNSALNFEFKKNSILQSNFHAIVASKWMEKKLKASPLFRHIPIYLIPFGIDQQVFCPISKTEARKKLKIPPNAFVVSFRCDRSEFKGLDNIEYVLRNIKTNKKIMVLALVGKLRENPRHFLVKEYGWVKDDSQLALIYSASDLFLMPSKVETFGMMAVEAMCCSTLPIVMDGTALPEVVNAPSCGISSKQDRDEFLKMVQYYHDNEDERIQRAKRCQIFAKKQYDLSNYIDKVIKVYHLAINSHLLSQDDECLLGQLKKNLIIYNDLHSRSLIFSILFFIKKIYKSMISKCITIFNIIASKLFHILKYLLNIFK